MQQWAKCILVLAWKITMVGAQCPSGFTCSGTPECYLIYPSEDGWKYTDPNGNIHDAHGDVYTAPNCYKFIRVTEGMGSCNDAQRECENVGGNITVINSNEEYDQLVNNVIYILDAGTNSTFNVHVQNLQLDDIQKGCANMTIEDGIGYLNDDDIENSDCSTTRMVDTIVCEATDVNTEICPVLTTSMPTSSTKSPVVPTTEAMQITPYLTTISSTTSTATIPVTQTRRWSTVDQPLVTDETTAAEHTSVVFTHPSKDNQSEMEAGPNLRMVVAIASIVVIIIIIILLSFLFIRCRHKRTKARNDKPEDIVKYQDNVVEDVHQNTLYNSVGLYNDRPTADEVVYQDITNEMEYHDTAVEVKYHDTAVEVEYQDTALEVVYQNSKVDRSKRTFTKDQFELEEQKKLHMASGVGAHTSPLWSSEPSGHEDTDHDLNVTNSTDCVDDIPYENSINAPERLRNVKTELEINEDYSEIDEFMLKEGGSTEADYLQIL